MTRLTRRLLPLAFAVALAACTTPESTVETFDPYEADNREVHAFNRGVDSVALRPAARGYGTFVPVPVREGVGNFSSNLGMPGIVVNDMLQGNLNDAAHNSFRFVLNTTLGFGGLFDIATQAGFEERTADFGETLAVWGAPEGAYLEVPFFGPRTERSFAGNIGDLVLNPINYIFGFEYAAVVYGAGAATVLNDRFVLGDTLDQILYDSADSYALLRSLYLQNRRFQLSEGGIVGEGPAFDPYEDLYGGIFNE